MTQATPTQPTVDERLMQAIRVIIREEFPRLAFIGRKAYTIQSATSTSCNAAPVDTTIGLPALVGAPLSPYLGVTCTPVEGTACSVEFLNGDPSRPMVTSFDSAPTAVAIGGSPAPLAVAGALSTVLTAVGTFATAVGVATPSVAGAATALNLVITSTSIATTVVTGT